MSAKRAKTYLSVMVVLSILCPAAAFSWHYAGTKAPAEVVEFVR